MMISQFWSLCRACPALDVDKLHSEYRSTYRWHEYTPKQQSAVVRTAPTPQPLTSSDGGEFSRGRKRAPDVAYKCHDLFEGRGRAMEAGGRVAREGSAAPRPGHLAPTVTFPGHQQTTAPAGWTGRHSSLRSRERSEARESRDRDVSSGQPKKSISMGQIQPGARGHDVNGNTDAADSGAGASSSGSAQARPAKEYKSEYKQKYRPFSQYEYVGEGRFHNTSTSPPGEAADTTDSGHKAAARRQPRPDTAGGEPWYKEVIELRKAANDYKCRGWGTDLVPPHLSHIYSQHVDEAAKRESLSALALAVTPRSLNKHEKEKENQRKSGSPMKIRSRPRTAPPKGSKKTSRSESARSTPGPGKCELDGGRPSCATPTPKEAGWKVHLAQDSRHPAPRPRRPNAEGRDKVGRGVSRASSKAQSRDGSRPPSAIENNIDYFKEPVVKSPPEPTRVRSPEQLMMRSPDPINWTVPLDTGKTFQVTQCVRESDSARNSPMSDHSSHFDSVLGTAINLGIHAVNEKTGALQHHKVSALAREAKELQGVRTPPAAPAAAPAPPAAATQKKEEAAAPAPAKAEVSQNSESSGYVTVEAAPAPTPGPAPAPEKINGAAKLFGAAVNGIEKDKNDNKIEQPRKSGAAEVKPLPAEATAKLEAGGEQAGPQQPKRPSYRVLEDPDLEVAPPSRPGPVIPDPMTTSIYEPKQ